MAKSITPILLALGGAAAVGTVLYVVMKPAAPAAGASNTSPATQTAQAATAQLTGMSQAAWNALTPAQQQAFATALGTTVPQLAQMFSSGTFNYFSLRGPYRGLGQGLTGLDV